jgi:N-acetyl-anhydromuramyl-L-alanine amidase AmpD
MPLQIDRSLRLTPNQYVQKEADRKDLIVLHNTAGGSAKGAFDWWQATPERVATAYIVERNGTVFEVFDPKYSAFHLGLEDTQANDYRSIGIELVNWGYLSDPFSEGFHFAWPENFKRVKVPGNEVLDVFKTSNPVTYRGWRYFQTYTTEQVVATAQLCKYLCNRFGIAYEVHESLEFLNSTWRNSYSGVAAHHNFRRSKTDVGPAFPYKLFKENFL